MTLVQQSDGTSETFIRKSSVHVERHGPGTGPRTHPCSHITGIPIQQQTTPTHRVIDRRVREQIEGGGGEKSSFSNSLVM